MNLIEEFNRSDLKDALIGVAKAAYPNEACGYLVRTPEGLKVYKALNTNENPMFNFTIGATDTVAASKAGELVAVFHSHTELNYPSFSHHDFKSCNAGELPWVLVKIPEGYIKWIHPNESLPFLEREFVWGEQDCFGLIRDVYSSLDIHINDYPRGELKQTVNGREDYIWNVDPEWNEYIKYFEKEGFRKLTPHEALQKYDVILFNYEAPFGVANHAGIFMEPENNIFYHHFLGRLSEKSIYGQGWRNLTIAVIRHKDLEVKNDAHGNANLTGGRERQILQEDRPVNLYPSRLDEGDVS